MRRADKEITDRAEIDDIIRRAEVCHLGMARDSRPYVVPLNFGYDGRAIYLHAATEGLKLDLLRENPQVCAQFEADVRLIVGDLGERCTTEYRSAIVFGRATIVEDIAEKRRGCDLLMRHYTDHDAACSDEVLARTAVIRIDIERVTGKRSG